MGRGVGVSWGQVVGKGTHCQLQRAGWRYLPGVQVILGVVVGGQLGRLYSQ